MNNAKLLDRRVGIPHHTITWLLIAGLFLLRIVLVGLLPTLVRNLPGWVNSVYELCSYFLTAVLIWWERENLAEFFVDKLALLILILGKPYELVMYWSETRFSYFPRSDFYWLYLPIAVSLLLFTLFAGSALSKLQVKNWLWLLVGIIVGGLVGIVVGYLLRVQFVTETIPPRHLPTIVIFSLPAEQLIHAAISEEPFFRGFLWGGLHRSGWKDRWILLFQTVLFMIGHLYYFRSLPISFWIIVPLGGVLLGILAWRSRSIATSMVGHAFFNAVGQMVAFYRF